MTGIPQAVEQTLSYSDFLVRMTGGSFEDIRWGPAYAAGTRVLALEGDVWRAFLISDLTAPAKTVKSFALITAKTTMSLSFVSTGAGLGAGVTFNSTANVLAFISGDASTDTAGDGFGYGVYASTTGVPATGVGVGGDTVITNSLENSQPANQPIPFCRAGLKQLVKGTQYFPYIAFEAVTGGTATIKATTTIQVVLLEV